MTMLSEYLDAINEAHDEGIVDDTLLVRLGDEQQKTMAMLVGLISRKPPEVNDILVLTFIGRLVEIMPEEEVRLVLVLTLACLGGAMREANGNA